MNPTVYIDDGFATDAEAKFWGEFVRLHCTHGHDLPIRHFTWNYAVGQQEKREAYLVSRDSSGKSPLHPPLSKGERGGFGRDTNNE